MRALMTASADTDPPPPETSGATVVDGPGDRVISRIVARDHAKLESRTWETDDHEGKPRVLYVAGDHVAYDDRRVEAVFEHHAEADPPHTLLQWRYLD